MIYFLDTYAMIEIIKGNKNFADFLEEDFFTSIFNLYELYYALLRDYNELTARKFFKEFQQGIVSVDEKDIFEASKFKFKFYKKKLSYADCLGYVMALRQGVKFLTGDNEFEDFENVEFVK